MRQMDDMTTRSLRKQVNDLKERARVGNEQASIYEKAGITGIHPSASTLRARAQDDLKRAQQIEESIDNTS